MLKVIKRNGKFVDYEPTKIKNAIEKAANSISKNIRINLGNIVGDITQKLDDACIGAVPVEAIENEVFDCLCKYGYEDIAKRYEGYRAVQEYKRKVNTSDKAILGLVRGTDQELIDDNSNKNAYIASTQRDLIAGEVSKDIAARKLLPSDIIDAHNSGAIYIHDMDYIIQPIFNCCLINLKDMFDNGTVINGKRIDTPKSFQVACTVMTQIIAQVASGQYGGQSINGVDEILAPYLHKSWLKYCDLVGDNLMAVELMMKELRDGVQTIQYQINTLQTSNGQSPFVTLFMNFNPDGEYSHYAALICEEILKQRIQGVKNEDGVYVTPAFPKLIYVLDEHNVSPNSRYYYLTKLAAECTAKRSYPDYISAKKMRETYGDVFAPMGCRSFLSPWKNEKGELVWNGRFNKGVVSINLPQVAILANGDENKFWQILHTRLALCKKALDIRHELLLNATSDISPIHWQHGAIARLKPGEKITKYLYGGYSTLSLGYIGLYETVKLLTGHSHTQEKGLAMDIIQVLRDTVDRWKEEENLGYALYGTPAESLTYKFCKKDQEQFGIIKDVTDKGYYTNSYHVDVREPIDAFAKFIYEADFQTLSTGGCISYVEIPNMTNNIRALLQMITFAYDNIQYAEFNIKSDYCYECGFDGEIKLDENNVWTCPKCGNQDRKRMTVVRRTCGLT